MHYEDSLDKILESLGEPFPRWVSQVKFGSQGLDR